MTLSQILKSKTIWLGLLVALIPFVQALQTVPMSPEMAGAVSSILGVLVMINRFYTTIPLHEK